MNETELKRYLARPENSQKISETAKFLQIDLKQLNNIIQKLATGEIAFEELSATLVDEMGISFDLALKVTLDLDRKIFAAVREDLDRIREGSPGSDWRQFLPDALAADLLNNLPDYGIWDNNLKIRFTEAIVSWLKDIRDIAELKDFMLKSPKIGGLGMSEPAFDRLTELLGDKKQLMLEKHIDLAKVIARYEEEQGGGAKVSSVVKESEIDVAAQPEAKKDAREKVTGQDITINQLLQTKGIDYEELNRKEAFKQNLQAKAGNLAAVIETKENFLAGKKEITPPSVAPAQAKPHVEPSVDSFADFDFAEPAAEPVTPPPPPQPVVSPEIQTAPVPPEPVKPFFRPQPTARPKVEDVKYSPYLYGPIEELASLTINDLRRLSKDPQEAVSKIIGKLDLLEDESLNKRADGVKALKKSPLYGLYADIMDRAILHGKPFEQILAETKTLNMAEFQAIMGLNKSLKY